ncbi:MAG: hypothetical protein E6K41_13570 [Gammaproteobacteria bacterium]|nr:MAG: hypothetical protein E6K41_13570 [Gammaproteobacteria bacterium]
MPLHAGREHFHYVLMRAGLSGRQVLAVLVAFSVFYATVGLIGASQKLPDWALFAPWITLLGLQHFIIRGLAVHLRMRRWRDSKIVVELPASGAATHSLMPLMPLMRRSRRLAARRRNGQGHPVGAVRAEELSPNGGSIFPAPPHDSKLPLGHPVSTSSVSSRPPTFTVRPAPRI